MIEFVAIETLTNFLLLIFSVLIVKEKRVAWVLAIAVVALKVFIYGKFDVALAMIYMSAQLMITLIATAVWFKKDKFIKVDKKQFVRAVLSSVAILVFWIVMMYFYVNPEIITLKLLFGFGYFSYMLFVIGNVFLAFHSIYGLLIISVVFISYGLSYAQVVMDVINYPDYDSSLAVAYGLSSVSLIIAGIVLVSAFTKLNKSLKV